MPRLSDNPPHSVYRVNVRATNREFTHVTFAAINVKASSPSVAADWVLSYPGLCGIPGTGTMEIMSAYKVRRQPVWLRKAGTFTYRFDVRRVETVRLEKEI
jgi:hypothetical protein